MSMTNSGPAISSAAIAAAQQDEVLAYFLIGSDGLSELHDARERGIIIPPGCTAVKLVNQDASAPGRPLFFGLSPIEARRQMLFAIDRSASEKERLAQVLVADGDYAAEFPEADAQALRQAAQIIAVTSVPNITEWAQRLHRLDIVLAGSVESARLIIQAVLSAAPDAAGEAHDQ